MLTRETLEKYQNTFKKLKEIENYQFKLAQQQFQKNNNNWSNKEFFDDVKKFSKLNNKMSLLNIKTNGIFKMADVEKMEKEKLTVEDIKPCTDLKDKQIERI